MFADSSDPALSKLLELVHRHYVESGDFNGYAVDRLIHDPANGKAFRELVEKGIRDRLLDAITSEQDVNPHIKRLATLPPEDQIKTLGASRVCLYPSRALLDARISDAEFHRLPIYTRMLRMGSAQLQPIFFDRAVLERFLTDPRYQVECSGIFAGQIYLEGEEHRNDPHFPAGGRFYLETFGIAYSTDRTRCLTTFLRYLHKLPDVQQGYWDSFSLPGKNRRLCDAYFQTSILGNWTDEMPIESALLQELECANIAAVSLRGVPLFRVTELDPMPLAYTPFARSTLKYHSDFLLLLEKLTCENLNHSFFTKADGGSVTKLTAFLRDQSIEESIVQDVEATFREIRAKRQAPAHKIELDRFDASFDDARVALLDRTFAALKSLRIALSRLAGVTPLPTYEQYSLNVHRY